MALVSVFAQKNPNQINKVNYVQEIVSELLTLTTHTRMCGDQLYYAVTEFCKVVNQIKFRFKRRNQEYGITNDCCYNSCNGHLVMIKYCHQ